MSEPTSLAETAADALPLPRMRPTTQGDPMNDRDFPCCDARLDAERPTDGLAIHFGLDPDAFAHGVAATRARIAAHRAPQRPTDAPTCQDTPDTPQPATEAHRAADTHDLIERAAHLARLGWAVEKLKNQGAVEFTLTQIEDAAREAGED